jgi:hypothetical protein
MSQHNIVGSEAFNRSPSVIIRSLKPGGLRRRKARTALAFIAGAVVTAVAGLAGAIAVFAPGMGG